MILRGQPLLRGGLPGLPGRESIHTDRRSERQVPHPDHFQKGGRSAAGFPPGRVAEQLLHRADSFRAQPCGRIPCALVIGHIENKRTPESGMREHQHRPDTPSMPDQQFRRPETRNQQQTRKTESQQHGRRDFPPPLPASEQQSQQQEERSHAPPRRRRRVIRPLLRKERGDIPHQTQQRRHHHAADFQRSRNPPDQQSADKHRKTDPRRRRHQQISRHRIRRKQPLMQHRNPERRQIRRHRRPERENQHPSRPPSQAPRLCKPILPHGKRRPLNPLQKLSAQQQEKHAEKRILESQLPRRQRIPHNQQHRGQSNRVQRIGPIVKRLQQRPDREHHKRPERRTLHSGRQRIEQHRKRHDKPPHRKRKRTQNQQKHRGKQPDMQSADAENMNRSASQEVRSDFRIDPLLHPEEKSGGNGTGIGIEIASERFQNPPAQIAKTPQEGISPPQQFSIADREDPSDPLSCGVCGKVKCSRTLRVADRLQRSAKQQFVSIPRRQTALRGKADKHPFSPHILPGIRGREPERLHFRQRIVRGTRDPVRRSGAQRGILHHRPHLRSDRPVRQRTLSESVQQKRKSQQCGRQNPDPQTSGAPEQSPRRKSQRQDRQKTERSRRLRPEHREQSGIQQSDGHPQTGKPIRTGAAVLQKRTDHFLLRRSPSASSSAEKRTGPEYRSATLRQSVFSSRLPG